ncbi:MAG: LUD domain-containing protein [Thermaerobacter sp.]|nr:LUD domain-containing protein [Thermaerobacter sp.]
MNSPEWAETLQKKGFGITWCASPESFHEAWAALAAETEEPIPVLCDAVTLPLLRQSPHVRWIAQPGDRDRLAASKVGVTGVSQLASRTGTLMLAEDNGLARWVSNLPPRHVALVPLARVAADWAAALANVRQARPERLPRVISWISGPSQTADIAGRLVRGMHGPRQIEAWILAWEGAGAGPLILDQPCGDLVVPP